MADAQAHHDAVDGGFDPSVKPVSRFTRWYRSPLFNVIIIGLISFTQPGIWNALNSTYCIQQVDSGLESGQYLTLTFYSCRHWRGWPTRAVPSQWRQLINLWVSSVPFLLIRLWVGSSNFKLNSIMVFGCSLFSILSNRFGVKKVLILGTLGYAPYSAALYVNNRYGTEWFVLFGGATCGIAASALWASEGAIALGYGRVQDRGKFSEWLRMSSAGKRC
jgi:hypothetical protein